MQNALKTVNGTLHPTFQSACRALGLLEDDAHWDRTLEDACISNTPRMPRELFATMLIFCQLADPVVLWNKHKPSLAEDIEHNVQREYNGQNIHQLSVMIYNMCLTLVEDIVTDMGGMLLQNYGLPEVVRGIENDRLNREYMREMDYNVDDLFQTISNNEPLLNNDQMKVYSEIIDSVNSGNGNIIFLDALGGTGKTFLINLLLAKVRQQRKIAIAAESSAIAATLLEGGKTAHSAFKLPLNLNFNESPQCNISKQSNMAQVLRECKLIVWDECTMAHKGGVEALNRMLQDIRSNSSLMGGTTVLLAGDFRQSLPVVPRGTRADEVKACIKSSFLWPSIKRVSLTTNMRVHFLICF